jgi:conjugal transfer pilus assembly protein TrbC
MRTSLLPILLFCALPACFLAAHAQTSTLPSEEQIANASAEAAGIFRRLDPDYKGLDKAPPGSAVKAPGGIMQPASAANFSLDDLAKKYAVPSGLPPEAGRKQHADLLVFVTLSMPKESLKRLSQQTEAAGGVLVLRGLKGSLKETARAVREISETASWQINPPAFTRYSIKAAPSFVITRDAQQYQASTSKNEDGCAPPQSFIAISGDVSLNYALEAIERESQEWRVDAALYLAKAKKGSN